MGIYQLLVIKKTSKYFLIFIKKHNVSLTTLARFLKKEPLLDKKNIFVKTLTNMPRKQSQTILSL